MTAPPPLLSVRNLKKFFPVENSAFRRRTDSVHAVDDVSFEVERGETFGLVGESGCGKSTLARCIVRLLEPTAGEIEYDGRRIEHLSTRKMRPLRRELQIVFQDPYASLNPRKRVGAIIGAPLWVHHRTSRSERKERVQQLLQVVGLSPEHYNRFPHEFSGGQRQRIGVARALALNPTLVVADEPVSALDVSIQAQVLNLLDELQDTFGLTYIFIAHDLGVVRHVSDRVAVMYLGKIVELAPADDLYRSPVHPYTEALLSAVPVPEVGARDRRQRVMLAGDVPSPINPPTGCRFHPRCRYATEVCREQEPILRGFGRGRLAACHHPLAPTLASPAVSLQPPNGTAEGPSQTVEN
jgi:peptide/nickel transport system ATP-binding protein